MKKFSDFNIPAAPASFVGNKIEMNMILNLPIKVFGYKIAESKFGKEGSKCLYLQIEFENEKRVVFSGSAVLADMIERVPKTEFPFTTTIVRDNKRFQFT